MGRTSISCGDDPAAKVKQVDDRFRTRTPRLKEHSRVLLEVDSFKKASKEESVGKVYRNSTPRNLESKGDGVVIPNLKFLAWRYPLLPAPFSFRADRRPLFNFGRR
jgi:hypothetical protein